MDYNGSAMVAMKGKNCVAIAADTRLSQQLMTISQNMQKVFKVNDKCLMGLAGLASDVRTLWVFFVKADIPYFDPVLTL